MFPVTRCTVAALATLKPNTSPTATAVVHPVNDPANDICALARAMGAVADIFPPLVGMAPAAFHTSTVTLPLGLPVTSTRLMVQAKSTGWYEPMSPAAIATPPPSITNPIWCGWLLALGRMPVTLVVKSTALAAILAVVIALLMIAPVAPRSPIAPTTPVCPNTLATDPPLTPHGAPASPIPAAPQLAQLPLPPRAAAIGTTVPVPTLLNPATAPAEL